MTKKPVMSITDEQIAEIEALSLEAEAFDWSPDIGMTHSETVYACHVGPTVIRSLIYRLREAEADAKRYRWLAHRPRWASAHADFDKTGTYREHRVVWFTGDDWPHATGQTLDAAIDAAMERTP